MVWMSRMYYLSVKEGIFFLNFEQIITKIRRFVFGKFVKTCRELDLCLGLRPFVVLLEVVGEIAIQIETSCVISENMKQKKS